MDEIAEDDIVEEARTDGCMAPKKITREPFNGKDQIYMPLALKAFLEMMLLFFVGISYPRHPNTS